MKKEVKQQIRAGLVGIALILLACAPAYAKASPEKNPCGPIRESKAYQQYKLRPVSEFSKLIYLIDRFYNCDIEVVYDGHYFKSAFAARVARWFLATNYKKESTKDWIMRWCNNTIPRGTPIYVKLPTGKFRLAREILTQELEELDRLTPQDESFMNAEVNMAPLAQLVVKSPASARIDPSR